MAKDDQAAVVDEESADASPKVRFEPRRKTDSPVRLSTYFGPEAKEVTYTVANDKPVELSADHPHVEALFRGLWAEYVKEV